MATKGDITMCASTFSLSEDKSCKNEVFCANCFHARRIFKPSWLGSRPIGKPVEKVFCGQNRWMTGRNGKGAFIDYFAVWNKTSPDCLHYDPMGDDLDDFIDALPQGKRDYLLITEGIHV